MKGFDSLGPRCILVSLAEETPNESCCSEALKQRHLQASLPFDVSHRTIAGRRTPSRVRNWALV